MAWPPSKRLRGPNHDVPRADPVEIDPFGDEEDFTQDDLDEIDIIASQAIGLAAGSGFGSKEVIKPEWDKAHCSGFHPSTRPPLDRENAGGQGSKGGRLGSLDREPTGNKTGQTGAERDDSYTLLEAQHADLRRKLKEVEEEIVSKNGEIRLLRDSLKGAQQEKETQRQALALLEKQKQREQSDKEKELHKKVQSLQSELQFKEAEINQIKTKLLSADKSKSPSLNSPKVPNGLSQLCCSGNSSLPTGSGFISKERLKTPGKTRRNEGLDKREVAEADPFLSERPPHRQHPGGVLLGLLLQQPLSPGSLCLSHLLSVCPSDVGVAAGPNSATLMRDMRSTGAGGTKGGALRATLSPVQSLAITGLNMLSQSQPVAAEEQENGCSGAVLLLPLLDTHLSRLCQVLDAREEASGSSTERWDEADMASVEDAGMAALRILYLLINHSREVVQALLRTQSEAHTESKLQTKTGTTEALLSHHALLRSVLRVLDGKLEEMVVNAVKVAGILIERTPSTHADRLACVLQALRACVLAHRKPRVLAECTAALVRACDHHALTRQLCSHHEPCVLLKLLQHVRKRPVRKAPHAELTRMALQVVRLLNRLSQTAENWQSSSCQCYIEVVQTSVLILHRQWLDLYDSTELPDTSTDTGSSPSPPWWRNPPASLLRECLLLLHWLLHHHGGFSASCRPLLHMYDQAVPALRDVLKRIPELSESEELAFEEISRPECDDTDDMDTESGS